ncbi:MAG: signal peptidase I [Synechococcus sp.]
MRFSWNDKAAMANADTQGNHSQNNATHGEPQRWWKGWRDLLVWVLLALMLRWVVLEPRWIPSGSMLPTLNLQDRILVEKVRPKLAQQQKHPLSINRIVVFSAPEPLIAAGYDPNTALIKRVVAGPGDVVEVKDGALWRNGSRVKEAWRNEPMAYTMPPIEVPNGKLWVLGDNRNASLDSHLWGPLDQERVIGTAVWRYWPLNRFGSIRFPLQTTVETDQAVALRSVS